MPPKKEVPAKAPAEESGADDEERELVEKELVITYLKSRLGRYRPVGRLILARWVASSQTYVDASRLHTHPWAQTSEGTFVGPAWGYNLTEHAEITCKAGKVAPRRGACGRSTQGRCSSWDTSRCLCRLGAAVQCTAALCADQRRVGNFGLHVGAGPATLGCTCLPVPWPAFRHQKQGGPLLAGSASDEVQSLRRRASNLCCPQDPARAPAAADV